MGAAEVSDLLTSRSGFELAAFFVTWATVALLVLMVSSMHVRLRRVEQRTGGGPTTDAPYSHLLGRRVDDLVGGARAEDPPRVLLFVSSGCATCQRLMDEVGSPAWTVPSALLWTDHTASAPAERNGVAVLDDGPRISAELGIRVTPFALVADEAGRIVRAGPINSLRSLGDLGGSSPAHASAHAAPSTSARGDG